MKDNTDVSESRWYGRQPDTYQVELLGEVCPGRKPILRRLRWGKEAYESHSIYGYLGEILNLRLGSPHQRLSFVNAELVWHFAFLRAADEAGLDKPVEFLNFGSTLYPEIDCLRLLEQALDYRIRQPLSWLGVEGSDYLAKVSRVLHPDSDLHVVCDWHNLPLQEGTLRLERTSMSTSYGITSDEEFVEWLALSDLSYSKIWFSGSNELQHTTMGGKRVTLFGFREVTKRLCDRGISVHFIRNEKVRHDNGDFHFTTVLLKNPRHGLFDAAQKHVEVFRSLGWRAPKLQGTLSPDDFAVLEKSDYGQLVYETPQGRALSQNWFEFDDDELRRGLEEHQRACGG